MFRVNTTRRNVKRAISPLKPATDVSGNTVIFTPDTHDTSTTSAPAHTHHLDKSYTSFFEAEIASVLLTKPWLRLERGFRLQKIRAFTDAYPSLSPEEKSGLYQFLVRANDAKQLNTKAQIQYENGVIQAVKGLKIIRTGDPSVPAVFKIEPVRQTKRNTNTAATDLRVSKD